MMSERLHLDGRMHWRVFDFVKRLHLILRQSSALADFRFCQRTAFDSEAVRCIGRFSVLPEGCIWRWDGQVHWRVFGFVRGLHLTLRRSDALADLTMPERLHFDDRMHWRISDLFRCFGYRCSDEILTVWWRRQVAGRQTSEAARHQMKKCLLAAKAGKLIREKMVKNGDSVVTLLWDVLNRLSAKRLIVTFLWDVPEVLKEKKSKTMIQLSAKQLIVTFLWDVPTELKEKKKIKQQIRWKRFKECRSCLPICGTERDDWCTLMLYVGWGLFFSGSEWRFQKAVFRSTVVLIYA